MKKNEERKEKRYEEDNDLTKTYCQMYRESIQTTISVANKQKGRALSSFRQNVFARRDALARRFVLGAFGRRLSVCAFCSRDLEELIQWLSGCGS